MNQGAETQQRSGSENTNSSSHPLRSDKTMLHETVCTDVSAITKIAHQMRDKILVEIGKTIVL